MTITNCSSAASNQMYMLPTTAHARMRSLATMRNCSRRSANGFTGNRRAGSAAPTREIPQLVAKRTPSTPENRAQSISAGLKGDGEKPGRHRGYNRRQKRAQFDDAVPQDSSFGEATREQTVLRRSEQRTLRTDQKHRCSFHGKLAHGQGDQSKRHHADFENLVPMVAERLL